ncbi:MAG: RluA family pseudouridine synthase [Synergistaceae bacterium]|nr:RluA family pseudouridine synthase [Synergistaceae bacterium]
MIELTAEEDFERMDIFLSEKLNITRSQIKKLITQGNIIGDHDAKPAAKVKAGDRFIITLPESENLSVIEPQPVSFEVVYEDNYLIVINKPAGVVVHPAPGNPDRTLVNGLVYRYPELAKLTSKLRPGIVHRLDMGTSGLMVVARNTQTALKLHDMFQQRQISKKYIALAHGHPAKDHGVISGPIERDPDNYLKMAIVQNGRPSLTGYKVLWTRNNFSLVRLKLFTGRTHQIRVHFAALGCPLVGDVTYGAPEEEAQELGRVLLHSWRLSFTHPVTGKKMEFRQYIPKAFISFIEKIKDVE